MQPLYHYSIIIQQFLLHKLHYLNLIVNEGKRGDGLKGMVWHCEV